MAKKNDFIAQHMSFEERCQAAKEGVTRLHLMVQQMAEEDLQHRQEKTRRNEAFLEVNADSEEAADFLKKFTGLLDETQESLLRSVWESGLAFERRVLGSDAVDCALKNLKEEHQSH